MKVSKLLRLSICIRLDFFPFLWHQQYAMFNSRTYRYWREGIIRTHVNKCLHQYTSDLHRMFLFMTYFFISSVSAFLVLLQLYTKKRKTGWSALIIVEWSTLFLSVMLSVSNPSINPGKKTHTCMGMNDHLLMKSPYNCLNVSKGVQKTGIGCMK